MTTTEIAIEPSPNLTTIGTPYDKLFIFPLEHAIIFIHFIVICVSLVSIASVITKSQLFISFIVF